MDFFAIASLGSYPTPTPTDSERMAFAVSYGLLDTLEEVVFTCSIFKFCLTLDLG